MMNSTSGSPRSSSAATRRPPRGGSRCAGLSGRRWPRRLRANRPQAACSVATAGPLPSPARSKMWSTDRPSSLTIAISVRTDGLDLAGLDLRHQARRDLDSPRQLRAGSSRPRSAAHAAAPRRRGRLSPRLRELAARRRSSPHLRVAARAIGFDLARSSEHCPILRGRRMRRPPGGCMHPPAPGEGLIRAR